ncbi:MAG TPA: hypothetical protein VKE50_00995 [Thermoanaerobaculia bacterium]|nr:hypothetical protein [Thermoanaerobaculia bacterium]
MKRGILFAALLALALAPGCRSRRTGASRTADIWAFQAFNLGIREPPAASPAR